VWTAPLGPSCPLPSLASARGGFCDCEVFLNGWGLRADLLVPDPDGEPAWPAEWPPCAGVGPRSSQPCAIWVPWRRPRW
jgi:hypothetical protein